MTLFLAVILCSLTIRLMVTVLHAESGLETQNEQTAMLQNIERVLGEDCHTAIAVEIAGNELVLRLPSGEVYHYAVNDRSQFVRYGESGGVTVLANAVQSVSASTVQGVVDMTVQMDTGHISNFTFSTLAGCIR